MIFATYWVCTVITTVGYGDYFGTTTLELEFTILLEFLGFVIFSVLQIGVLQIVNAEKQFDSEISEIDFRVLNWLMTLENSSKNNTLSQ